MKNIILAYMGVILLNLAVGCEACKNEEVEPETEKEQPTVSITHDQDGYHVAVEAVIYNMTNITNVVWTFGDTAGTQVDDGDSDSKTALYYYSTPGTHTITVRVTGDSDFGVLTKQAQVNVTISGEY